MDVLSLNQQIIRGEVGKEGIVRALSRRLRGAVLSFVGAAAVGRVKTCVNIVIGVVIVVRFFADARGSGSSYRNLHRRPRPLCR